MRHPYPLTQECGSNDVRTAGQSQQWHPWGRVAGVETRGASGAPGTIPRDASVYFHRRQRDTEERGWPWLERATRVKPRTRDLPGKVPSPQATHHSHVVRVVPCDRCEANGQHRRARSVISGVEAPPTLNPEASDSGATSESGAGRNHATRKASGTHLIPLRPLHYANVLQRDASSPVAVSRSMSSTSSPSWPYG